MRNWKNWLFPLLTALTVTALALLPLHLSTLEDGRLTGTVHTEPLAADNNFPARPPDLPGRIWLLLQLAEMPENLTVMNQELEGGERDREMARLREALADLGSLLPSYTAGMLTAADGDSWNWERYYLRDRKDLSGASFTMASSHDQKGRVFLSATLDGESGQLLSLVFHHVDGVYIDASARELGEAILDRLGLDYTLEEDFDASASFRLPDCKSLFWILKDGRELDFSFTLDWEAVDSEIAVSYGHEHADADSMQKW
nr:hypothetical protein [uncultured Oscillibacter sp.]